MQAVSARAMWSALFHFSGFIFPAFEANVKKNEALSGPSHDAMQIDTTEAEVICANFVHRTNIY